MSVAGVVHQRPERTAALHAGLEPVAVGTAPVRLEADRPAIAVARQRPHLPAPVDAHLAERAPDGLVVLHVAVLGVHVADPVEGKELVSVRKHGLAEDGRVGRIPDQLQRRVIDRGQQCRRLRRGGDVAGVLVLEADDDALRSWRDRRGSWSAAATRSKQRSGSTVRQYEKTRMIPAPVRAATSNARSARRGWSSKVYAEPKTSCWKRASSAGASGSTHLSTGEAMVRTRMPSRSTASRTRVDLLVREVDDVPAEDDAQLDAGHAEAGHGVERGVEVRGGELVGDRGDRNHQYPSFTTPVGVGACRDMRSE